ncbi:MAG: polysaccharide biosynthesis/export family protein, partial [Terriglobia bacterium]
MHWKSVVNTEVGVRRIGAIRLFLIGAFFAASLAVLARAALASTDSAGKPARAVVSGRTETTTPPSASASTPSIGIDSGDLLKIDVFDVPELSGTYRVHSGGEIEMPLLRQPIEAAGLST